MTMSKSRAYVIILLTMMFFMCIYISWSESGTTQLFHVEIRNVTDCNHASLFMSMSCHVKLTAHKFSQIFVSKQNTSETLTTKEVVLFPSRLNSTYTIYLGTKFYKRPNHFTWGKFIKNMDSCPELKKKCVYSFDHKDADTADMVVVYVRNAFKMVNPDKRPPYQKWVFSIIESPIHTYNNLMTWKHHFNITMTYSLHSTVPLYYGLCTQTKVSGKIKKDTTNFMEGKKFDAAWFVHNCKAPSKRQDFVAGLSKYIDVHRYGCQGKYDCPYDQGQYCDQVVLHRDYKFYLALENSFCDEYLTEKTFRILSLNVIPIISSHENLTIRLPPHSYIDTRDFKSYKELGDYIKKVGSDEKLYNEYFTWRQKGWSCYKHEDNKEITIGCRLCQHAVDNRQKIEIADIYEHWDKAKHCISGDVFYKNYFT